jgi:hypothetical protein
MLIEGLEVLANLRRQLLGLTLGHLAPVFVSIARTASSNEPRATSKAKRSRSPCE